MARPARSRTAPWRASYAVSEGRWAERLHPEPPCPHRSPFQRDRDRIIHSTAFRRLKHKTQVFVAHEGDHYRTRLTHSLEVAQIARTLARNLGLDEDLTEALALAHDLGHTPFGHAGEEALDRAMAPFGGFDHNAQTLRIVTHLEHRYAAFDGLNLTFAALDGLVKHNGPVAMDGLEPGVRALVDALAIEPSHQACLEAQVAALADDIAYDNHDIDDGLRAELFDIEPLFDVPMVGEAFRVILARYPHLERRRLIHEAVRRLIGGMIEDVLREAERRLEALGPRSADDIAKAQAPLIAFSPPMQAHDAALKAFLRAHMYRHPRVRDKMTLMKQVVAELFAAYIEKPALLPAEMARQCAGPRDPLTARVVADFIAGMTDNFALSEHKRLIGTQ
jgi:dGTPase